jgi:hypothetical protein
LPSPLSTAVLLAVSFLAGIANAIAGGGTLLTFPALVGLGVPAIAANATSTVALWPGGLSSMWGYRRELSGVRAWAIRFAVPSIIGGLTGAALLLRTPEQRFAQLVPFLVLGATLLFLLQKPLVGLARRRGEQAHVPAGDAAEEADVLLSPPALPFLLGQFGVAVYGGYFGAGAGIMMLAALGLMGLTNIHKMNGLKNWAALCFNAVAVAVFIASGLVHWPLAILMAAGSGLGGWTGSHFAQRVPQSWVRGAVTAIGLGSAAWLAMHR